MKKEQLEQELKAARQRISELEANLKIDEMESAPFRYVVEHSVDLIQSVRANGRFEFVNRAWLDSLGYSPEDVKSLELKDVIHPDHWARCDDAFKRIQKGEQIPLIETVLVGKDQQQILVDGTASARILDGKFHATYSVLRDVTKSRRAEELLRLSQEKLNGEMRRHAEELEERVEERTRELEQAYQELQSSAAEIEDLYNNAPCGYHSLNKEGRFVRINDTLLNWLGYDREEVLGRDIKEFLSSSSSKIFGEYFPILKKDFSAYDQEMEFIRKSGEIFSVSLSATAIKDEYGNFLRTRTTSFDVSERKRAEQALRDSETYARLLFEASPDPISVADVDGVMIDVNHVFEQQHGLAREAAQGRNIRDLGIFADHDLQKAADYIAGVLSGANPAPIELDFPSPDGAMHTLELHSYPIVVNNKQLILSTSRDITTHKQAALALRLANAEMERTLKLKDEFLANMSHELRTPLNAILGIAESLQNQIGGTLNEKQLKYVQIIRESGTHLLTLITDILDLSKIEAGRMDFEFQDVLLEPLCQSSLRMVKELAYKKQLNVTFTMDERVQSLHVDERRIKQVLVNLLMNAVKFTPQGGNVGLDISADPDNAQIHLAVWDSGIGITKEDLPRLFKPFVQLDASLSREYSGTGLGLVLVAQMARLHGGSVSVESQPRKGSRFTITLPWDEVKITNVTQPHKGTGTEQILSNRSGTILLVEDTEAVIFVTSEYLETLGYKVIVARHGEEGVKLAQIHRP
ncbi:MAG: PAS domain S-box protein, partial [Chloroflexi bacterium]|nr:PAS domain S-box protein [Chloroflexota bacterium]